MDKVRTFICIELPEKIRDDIAALQHAVKPMGRGVRWVQPRSIHLTFKFLGDVEQDQLNKVEKAVKEACNQISSFALQVNEAGAFPNFKSPRIYWTGFRSVPDMMLRLQSEIENELCKIGFAKEKRKFTPHLTIGRVKYGDGVKEVSHYLQNNSFESGSFDVESVTIMKSELSSAGAKYTPLAKIQLHS
ncbi:RNA 2',3'-cyclic phosphodiesterase [candidate division KSB1 bacterium]|nr:RNA 2',3'-cyclic phosphodiesterase [candidate division KSB1 bacterium]